MLASGQDAPVEVQVDDAAVYWINSGKAFGDDQQHGLGAVVKLPKSASAPVVLAKGQDVVISMTQDASSIYWTSDEGVFKVSKAGGPASQIHIARKGGGWPSIIRVDGSIVYVGIMHQSEGGLYVWTKTRPELRPLNTGFFGIHGMAVDSGGMFLCMGPTGKMLGYSQIADGKDEILLKGLGDCGGVVSDDDRAYWVERKSGLVRSIPRTGGVATTLASGQKEAWALVRSGNWIYWTDREGGMVSRVPKTGGSVQVLASALKTPQGLDADGKSIYWVSREEGVIYSLPLEPQGAVVPSSSGTTL
jgi:hypothetical protein